MMYHQLTSGERYMLSALRKQGCSPAYIARQLGRHRSTISRELHRNASKWGGWYRPTVAIENTGGRRARSRRNRRFRAADVGLVEQLIRRQWRPEQVAGYLRRTGQLSISHETIYRHIWADWRRGGTLHRELRGARKQRRKRYRSYDSRGRLAGKRHISERPASVERRRHIGHWEVDTLVGVGAKDCVATLVERKTGFALLGQLADRTSRGMRQRLQMLIRRAPRRFKTVTADNGTEFHEYLAVEQQTGVTFYFATPYHAWERASNENLNGLLRQYLPKRSSFAGLTQRDCDALAHRLNTRPRKRLGFRTPEECFYAQ